MAALAGGGPGAYLAAMFRWVALFLSLLPASLAAHPHIFVDTGLRIDVNAAGEVTGIEVTWAYDELYTLLIFEDRGLDADLDGNLTEAELKSLEGFDLNWSEGFEGDLYLTLGGVPVALGPPESRGIRAGDGRMTSVHYRPVTPVSAKDLLIKAYDPTFYTAYALRLGVDVRGGCRPRVTPADLDAAYSKVEELLYATPADQTEDGYPEVGAAFADEVRVVCGGA